MTDYAWVFAAYLSLASLIAGVAIRMTRIARMPVHLRWELAPVPGEGKKHGGSFYEETDWWLKPVKKSFMKEILFMAREIFLLHGVWKKNRMLWPFSYAFHMGLYLLVVYLFIIIVLGAVLKIVPNVRAAETALSAASIIGGAGYSLGSIGVACLLFLRIVRQDLRIYSGRSAYFNLLMCGLMLASGLAAWLDGDAAVGTMEVVGSMMSLSPVPGLSPAFTIHLGAVLLFVAVLPWTQMIHFLAKFFTYHQVLWDDRTNTARMESKVAVKLGGKITWSAGHVGDGSTSWIDAVKEEKQNGQKNQP